MMNARSITSCMVLAFWHFYAFSLYQPIQERIKTMNSSQSWINNIQQQLNDKNSWQFIAQGASGKAIVVEWQASDILSPFLAEFKKEVADLAAHTTAMSEAEFLHYYPEAVTQEMFLKPCAPLFEQGVDNVDWNAVKETIRNTIKQFYCVDIKAFGEQALKMLSNDLYFFARAIEQDTGVLLGFCMLAITPNLAYGDIKLITIAIEPAEQHRDLEKLFLESLFTIIKPQRIFTAIRSTDIQTQKMLASCGFMVDEKPQQDPNHMLNLMYFTIMEYKADQANVL